ncbi:hypothetical protein AB833_10525 [Chromatiales bacterium (ex Bugula neritina AB1)]|nr:hypothetical protein AB833_10525 [Chromatiales bacterium (ex Bugula neritina AB1)]
MKARQLVPVLVICSGLAIYACAATESLPSDDKTDNMTQATLLEKIHNPVYHNETIRFSVVSHGCTKPSHFDIEHNASNQQCQLTVIRNKPDLCRKARALIKIELAWSLPLECAEMDVAFRNPPIKNGGTNTRISKIKHNTE